MRIKKLQRPFHLSARCLPTPQISPGFEEMLSRALGGLGSCKNGSSNRPFPVFRPRQSLDPTDIHQRRKQIGSIARQEDDATRSGILDWLNENELARNTPPRANRAQGMGWLGKTEDELSSDSRSAAFLVFLSATTWTRVVSTDLGASRTTGGNSRDFRSLRCLRNRTTSGR